jgi:hypothetical protein
MDYKSLSTAIFVGFVILLTLYIIFNNKKSPKRPEPQPFVEGFKNYIETFDNASSFDAATIKLLASDVFKIIYGREITNDEATYYVKFFAGVSGGEWKGKDPQDKNDAIDSVKLYMTQVMTADKVAKRDVSKVTPDPINDSTQQSDPTDGIPAPKFPLNAQQDSNKFFNWNDKDRPVTNPENENSKVSSALAMRAISTTNLPPFQSQGLNYAPVDVPTREQSDTLGKTPVISNEELPKMIDTLYYELFTSKPSDEEMDFYIKFFKGTQSTRHQIREVIATSAPSLLKIMKVGIPANFEKTASEGTEDEVIAIFNQILDRNPNEKELKYFAAFIKESPTNIERMKIILLQSDEYKHLSNMQTNMANGQLLGGLSDKQLTIIIKSIYNDMSPTPMDDDTLRFLKKKYLEFKLDEGRLRRFIKRFVMFTNPIEEAAYDTKTNTTAAVASTPAHAPAPAPSTTPNSSIVNQLTNVAFTPAAFTPSPAPTNTLAESPPVASTPSSTLRESTGVINTTPSSLPIYSNSAIVSALPSTTSPATSYVMIDQTNATPAAAPASAKKIIETFAQGPTPAYEPSDFKPSPFLSGNDTGVNTKKLIDAIKAKATSDFDKDKFYNEEFNKNSLENAFNGELSVKEKELSSLINDRNRDELKNTCMRNKDFAQYHYEDMNILPTSQYSVIPNDTLQQSAETMWNIRH